MNIKLYLTNPGGKGNSIYMIHEMKRILDEQYMRMNSKFRINWYNVNDKSYVAHVKIPSRSVDNLFYDVLIEFDMNSIPENTTTVDKGNAKVFSNCPSFTYTFANVFNKKGDLIPWCKSKYPSEIFSKEPLQRNPYQMYNYERSIYMAMCYVLSGQRNVVKAMANKSIKVKNYQKILNEVRTSTEVEEIYKQRQKQQKEATKAAENKTKDKKQSSLKASSNIKHKPGVTKTVKTTKNTKKTKVTKKTNKI